jgi:hypothetical protein
VSLGRVRSLSSASVSASDLSIATAVEVRIGSAFGDGKKEGVEMDVVVEEDEMGGETEAVRPRASARISAGRAARGVETVRGAAVRSGGRAKEPYPKDKATQVEMGRRKGGGGVRKRKRVR